jgi:radical SAM superfamily enzyme with C-terminal helix-hairpin-helix motif
MNVTILDCYVDEASCLGVPPFISPYVRYTAGAVLDSGHEVSYLTIDQYRKGAGKQLLNRAQLLVVIGGAIVPGKYLRGTPASVNEIKDIAQNFTGTKILGGPVARFGFSGTRKTGGLKNEFDFVLEKDVDAFVFDFLLKIGEEDRLRTEEEWCTWSLRGAPIISRHPDFPFPLIVELETYRGCVRYFTGGCSFCVEPLFGEPAFRLPAHVIFEVKALAMTGAVNFRLGAQSCIFSYGSEEIGNSEIPRPNPPAVEGLLKGIREACPKLKVLHTDNANPAVIAEHEDESRDILEALVKYCTSGNVLALGMESADPQVVAANNLNATSEEVMKAVALINDYGAQRGATGMPKLLPGINILCGLEGETKETHELNFKFLKRLLDSGLLLRRINIRQVASVRRVFRSKTKHSDFVRFKRKVREEIDFPMLRRLVPGDTVLTEVLVEKRDGNTSFGRQVGSYPLLIGIPYPVEPGTVRDVIITDHGYRSATGIEHPMNVNSASLLALTSIPGIGKKRAARIIRKRPISSKEELHGSLDDKGVALEVERYLTFD